jgi:glycosyltransferase involved in cell wall biosynthesis
MKVSVVMTVLNDRAGCAAALETLLRQSRAPDEVVVVDGGSTDGTREYVASLAGVHPHLRLMVAPDCNIAAGRNLGIAEAAGPIIATTDAGCRLDAHWLEKLVRPFESDSPVDVVAGLYAIEAHSVLERVVGLATMRGQMEPVNPATFNPSARSMAFRKDVWARAGGFPDWLYTSEDTLFDLRLRKMGVRWALGDGAVVRWRPRSSLRSIGRQFYLYGRGRGHTQIESGDYVYHLRNLGLLAGLVAVGFWQPWAWALAAVAWSYFCVWGFHRRCWTISRHLGSRRAYALGMLVLWTVMLGGAAGYVTGTFQRWRRPAVFRGRMAAYMAGEDAG